MLRRGQTGTGIKITFETIVLAVFIILAFGVWAKLFAAIINPDDQDIDQLARRIEFLSKGSYAFNTQEHYASTTFASNLFIVSGKENHVLMAFNDRDDVIVTNKVQTKQSGGARSGGIVTDYNTVTFKNKCRGACVCDVEVPKTLQDGAEITVKRSSCSRLRIPEGIELKQVFQTDQVVYLFPDRTPHEEEYGDVGTNEYHKVFLPYDLLAQGLNTDDRNQLLLYLEYFPEYNSAGLDLNAKILITPFDDQALTRADEVRICRTPESGVCQGKRIGSAIENSKQYCRQTGSATCTPTQAPDCKHGPITDACVCAARLGAEVARDNGVCFIAESNNAQFWYNGEDDQIRCVDIDKFKCEDYCPGQTCGTSHEKQHACLTDYCDVSPTGCKVAPDSARAWHLLSSHETGFLECKTGTDPVQVLHDQIRQLLEQNKDGTYTPGYRWTQLEFEKASGYIVGFPAGYDFKRATDPSLLEIFDNNAPTMSNEIPNNCQTESCICGSRTPQGFDQCTIVGPDIFVFGDSPNGVIENSRHVLGTQEDLNGLIMEVSDDKKLLVEVLVFEDNTAWLRVDEYRDGHNPTESSIRYGFCGSATGRACPPSRILALEE